MQGAGLHLRGLEGSSRLMPDTIVGAVQVDEMYYRLETSALHAGQVHHNLYIASERDLRSARSRWVVLAYLFERMVAEMVRSAPDLDPGDILYEISPARWDFDGGFIWLEPDAAAALGYGLDL